MTWKFQGRGKNKRGIPIDDYDLSGPMQYSRRCEICDLAFAMGLSEEKFITGHDPMERAQLLATYRSQAKRSVVVIEHPVKK